MKYTYYRFLNDNTRDNFVEKAVYVNKFCIN